MRAKLGLLLLGVTALGCYTGSAHDVSPRRAAAVAQDASWKVVGDVPFVKQQSDADCGPAALAMVLAHFGVQASLADVVAMDPPDSEGVRAGALRDTARAKGLSAFVVPGTFVDLVQQLERGRPILVGLAKPIVGGRAVAHYEVVVAIDRKDKRIMTLDPGRGLRENSLEGFAREWVPTGQVTIIVFRADQPGAAQEGGGRAAAAPPSRG